MLDNTDPVRPIAALAASRRRCVPVKPPEPPINQTRRCNTAALSPAGVPQQPATRPVPGSFDPARGAIGRRASRPRQAAAPRRTGPRHRGSCCGAGLPRLLCADARRPHRRPHVPRQRRLAHHLAAPGRERAGNNEGRGVQAQARASAHIAGRLLWMTSVSRKREEKESVGLKGVRGDGGWRRPLVESTCCRRQWATPGRWRSAPGAASEGQSHRQECIDTWQEAISVHLMGASGYGHELHQSV